MFDWSGWDATRVYRADIPGSTTLSEQKQSGTEEAPGEDRIDRFAIGHVARHTVEIGTIFGSRQEDQGCEHCGEHRLARVTFAGGDPPPVREPFLPRVAAEVDECSVCRAANEDARLTCIGDR